MDGGGEEYRQAKAVAWSNGKRISYVHRLEYCNRLLSDNVSKHIRAMHQLDCHLIYEVRDLRYEMLLSRLAADRGQTRCSHHGRTP